MKRIIALFLLLLLLAACQPTPEQEFIVNRAEEPLPAEAESSAETVAVPIDVPAHVSEQRDPTEHVTVVVDADVEFDPNAPHPMIEVEALDLTRDDAAFSAFLELVSSDATLYREWPDTKEEIGEWLKSAYAYQGQLGSLVDRDIALNLLEQQYRNAPESPEKIRADRLETGKNYYLERSDGSISLISVNFEPNDVIYARDMRNSYCTEDFLAPDDPIVLTDPTISEADALKKAEAFIKTLGVECDCLVKTERGFTYRYYDLGEMLWVFNFVRAIDGTPSIDRPNSFMTSPDTPSSVGAPWAPESVRIYVGKDGVVCANFWGLSKAKRVTVKNAQLCDFEKVLDAGIRQIGYLHDGAMDRPHHTYTVTDIKLHYAMQTKKDDLSTGVYQPMWEFTYVDADVPDAQPQKLYISAITGGHVEPRLTTKELMRYAD